jgi:hypothetical protein
MKNLVLIVLGLIAITTLMAQDIINPYLPDYDDYYGKDKPTYSNSSMTWFYDSEKPDFTYWGEYQTFDKLLNWNSSYAQSIKLEVVSFPMTNDCWSVFGGCTDENPNNPQPTHRKLNIIHDNLINEKWDLLHRSFEGNSSARIALISQRYASGDNIGPERKPFPHTVIKHTLNYHCGSSIQDDIIVSLSWVYDNTRGRMRYYPFQSRTHNIIGQSPAYDIAFFPEVLFDYNIVYDYNQIENKSWIDDGTLNYFPYSEILPTPCNQLLYPYPSSYYYDNGYDIFPTPPPFSILGNTSARSAKGKMIAGYNLSSSGILDYADNTSFKEGIKHEYLADFNFNVSEINPNEKLIYNPSELDITATDFIFPAEYTFKTIRGVYPVLSEVALSIGAEGNYHDLRDVPVYTDLTGEDVNDATNDNPPRAAKYYIKSGGKLTIEPCVTIYDATFLIESGGTLVFQDRESTYGRFEIFEEAINGTHTFIDQQGNVNTYNLIDQQGMVTRPVSLVPQGNTFLYESNDLIESGTAQQLPVNLNLPVIIAPETHVVFVAENEIKLTPGFHAKADHSPSGQSVFHALIWPSHCAGSGNRMMASNNNSQSNYQPQKFLYPTNPVLQLNPSRNNSRLHFSVIEDSKVSVKLYNAMGQLVNTPLNGSVKEKGNHIVEIRTEGLQPGIYLCTLYTEVNGSKKPMQVSRKLLVE